MHRSVCARLAWRYLVSRKSHSAVSAIAAVAVCGVAVATAAIICVLSVFNGFRNISAGRLDTLYPDIEITPASGKVMADGDSLAAIVAAQPYVEEAWPVMADNALLIANGREMPIFLRGVAPAESQRKRYNTQMLGDGHLYTENYETTLSIGIAASAGSAAGTIVEIFAPRRTGRINTANPANSFLTDSLLVTGVYQTNEEEFDTNRVLTDISVARNLFQYDTEATSIEADLVPGVNPSTAMTELTTLLGGEYNVRDKARMNQLNFRMVEIEKWITYLLLFFILLIASFNLVSTISILVLEKRDTIGVLRAMGLTRNSIGRVFAYESLYVALTGGFAGILGGLGLCWLQQRFGFIKLNGDEASLLITAYPVHIELLDIWLTLIPVVLIGMLSALIASSYSRRFT